MDIAQLAFIMESVGVGEWVVLLAVILIVMGPKGLPDMARKLGRWVETFRRAADEFKRQIMTMDEEVRHEVAQETEYASGEGSDVEHAQTSPEATPPEAHETPEGFSETEGQVYQDAYPSEGLPDAAPYYGNEELVAGMENAPAEEKKEGEKQA